MQDFFISRLPLLLAKEGCQETKKTRKCFTFGIYVSHPVGEIKSDEQPRLRVNFGLGTENKAKLL